MGWHLIGNFSRSFTSFKNFENFRPAENSAEFRKFRILALAPLKSPILRSDLYIRNHLLCVYLSLIGNFALTIKVSPLIRPKVGRTSSKFSDFPNFLSF